MGRGLALIGVLALGCGPSIFLPGETDGDGSGDGTTAHDTGVGPGPDDGNPQPTTASPGTSGVVDTGGADRGTFGESTEDDGYGDIFIVNIDDGVVCGEVTEHGYIGACECDVFDQDCPIGEKCMPWGNDGGNVWNATRCSPIQDDPGLPGDPCTVEGSAVSGLDSCDLATMCFYVDPATNTGTCVAMCEGSAKSPICDDGNECLISNDGSLALCLPTCNPLAGACPMGQVCQPVDANFFCVPPAADPVAAGDPCSFLGDCQDGLGCIPSENVGCDGDACCSPFCNLDDGVDMNPACLDGQTCTAWYDDGQAPVGFEQVGVCTIGA